MLFNIGDLVTRKSHNNDIIFKIIEIRENIVYLKGADIRLLADSNISDLVKVGANKREDDTVVTE